MNNDMITSWGKIVLTVRRFQSLSHIMNILPLRTYTPSFIEIEGTNYELGENVLITSRGKIVLTVMRFQWVSDISQRTYIQSLIEIEINNYQ
jgi:hypothetical protein